MAKIILATAKGTSTLLGCELCWVQKWLSSKHSGQPWCTLCPDEGKAGIGPRWRGGEGGRRGWWNCNGHEIPDVVEYDTDADAVQVYCIRDGGAPL